MHICETLKESNDEINKTVLRKFEHLRVCLEETAEGPLTNWLEYVTIPHCANPELNFEDVDLSIKFLNKKLRAPLIVTAITGGAPGTEKINKVIAKVVEDLGLAMGVGSQRAALENPSLAYTFSIVRDFAPTAIVIANIGASQLVDGLKIDNILKIIDMVKADALSIHLNPAQEVFQAEGKALFKGLTKILGKLVDELPIPIVIKEVGCGISYEVAKTLREVGIRYFDIAGAGGTNWVLVEMLRLKKKNMEEKAEVAKAFLDWCIPTAASILDTRLATKDSVIIASGGIRTGVDVVKSIALGADLAGMALPILKALTKNENSLRKLLIKVINEIKIATFLAGARTVYELKSKHIVLYGPLKDWLISRGFTIKEYIKIKSVVPELLL